MTTTMTATATVTATMTTSVMATRGTSTPTRRLRCHHDRGAADVGDAGDEVPPPQWPASPSIVDDVVDLLTPLPVHRRWGLIAYLSEQYYDGWRPSRTEIADLVAVELGVLTPDDYVARAARRRIAPGSAPTSRRC